MTEKTTSIHYIAALVTSLERNGIDPWPYLSKFNIKKEELKSLTTRVPFSVLTRFTRYAWAVLQDENLGLSSKALPNGAFIYASRLAMSAESLGQGLTLMVGLYNYIDHGYKINLVPDGNDIILELVLKDPSLDDYHFLADFVLCGIHRFGCWLTGKEIPIKSVTFNFSPPPFHTEYALLYGCRQEFNQDKLSIRFSRSFLNLAIVKKYSDLDDYIATTPYNILTNPVDQDNFTTKVKRIIEAHDGPDFPRFEDVSQQLHMVPKTLRQKLKGEGNTYQQIKDVIRKDLALYCLQQPNYTIADIAEKTGFTETGAFIRAFKNWTGVTPGIYRKEYLKVI
ncbi:AraC family transcriptional regulator [Thalassotalea sp. LPB0316]|uniref:AraC family transcriptional regulator n=1 Tax=Thalassotalea sp. LPB0316 TaxID=2769490 RepID=UPI001865AC61|nr:AraC family transcriptional regulator [Thalassotalea sp. LPB0316]QOL24586.1 AraC family transcriptional regulator [Thalassotalea sp. LPB0316]